MKIFTRSVQITGYFLSFSLLGVGNVLADTSPRYTQPLLARTATTDTTAELTIDPPLTAAQKATLKTIDEKYQPLIQAAAQRYKNSLKALEALLGTNPSDDTIRNRYEQAKDARGELTDLLLEKVLELRGVLNPQQRTSLADDIRRYLEKQ